MTTLSKKHKTKPTKPPKSKISRKLIKVKKNNRSKKKTNTKPNTKLKTSELYNKFLQNKIKFNINQYKKGKYKSKKQALAVSYSQANYKYNH
jgi:hypothetical protein